MTQKKHFKELVRKRMNDAGERYTAARRNVLQMAPKPREPHRPGLVPGSTALRVLLAHQGLDYTEPMVFGLAGGVGIGLFSFFYEKEDFASFFIAGRHSWHDELTYLCRACERMGQSPLIKEATTPKAAEKNLREMLDAHGPCVAWVDLALLPHRGLQHLLSMGGGYHIVTVYSVDDAARTAQIGDLTDEPVSLSLDDLTRARGRNKKDRYRLLAIGESRRPGDQGLLVHDALKACHAGLQGAGAPKNAKRNFSLDALETWADRLTSSKDKERWERVFAPGRRFFSGLLYLHLYVEYYGTGGGLCRPIMAEFLFAASRSLQDPRLAALGEQYARLGEQWSELADMALTDSVPPFAEAKRQLALYAEIFHSGGSADDLAACWRAIKEIERRVHETFPLNGTQCAELRRELRERVLALHAGEKAAYEALGRIA